LFVYFCIKLHGSDNKNLLAKETSETILEIHMFFCTAAVMAAVLFVVLCEYAALGLPDLPLGRMILG